jgi:hypothetical protein
MSDGVVEAVAAAVFFDPTSAVLAKKTRQVSALDF